MEKKDLNDTNITSDQRLFLREKNITTSLLLFTMIEHKGKERERAFQVFSHSMEFVFILSPGKNNCFA